MIFRVLIYALTWYCIEVEASNLTYPQEVGEKDQESCPIWTVYNSTSKECVCGDSLLGIVECDVCNKFIHIDLKVCYCMSYYYDDEGYKQVIVGNCLFTCVSYLKRNMYRRFNESGNNMMEICKHYNRRGVMCADCEKGHAPPAYYYDLICVECSQYRYNWLKYIAVAYLPLILCYFITLTIKIEATAGSMIGFVTINQLAAAPGVVRFYFVPRRSHYLKFIQLIATVCTFWNLDFFRSLWEPFCLHPSMTTLQVFALDYLLGVFPLILIIVTFFFVKLHDRYSLIVCLWRPFYMCFSHFSKKLNIKTSLIQAFATFILLSYVKILNVSFDILTPGKRFRNVSGIEVGKRYWYYNGSLEYLGKDHIPYAILAILMAFIFNILPLFILFMYPFSCSQKLLHHCRLNNQALRTFLDMFYGCYRTKPRDCRQFAAVYFILRIANLLLFSAFKGMMYFSYAGYLFTLVLVLVAIVRPYRKWWHNTADMVLLLAIATYYQFVNSLYEGFNLSPEIFLRLPKPFLVGVILAITGVPGLYGVLIITRQILPKSIKIKLGVFANTLSLRLRLRSNDSEESLPYRLQQNSEQSPLLSRY